MVDVQALVLQLRLIHLLIQTQVGKISNIWELNILWPHSLRFQSQLMYPNLYLITGGFSQHHPDSVVAVSNSKGTKLKSQLMHHCKRNSVNVSIQDDDDIMEVEDHQRAMLDKLNGNPAAAVFVSSISNSSQPIFPLLETQM